MIIRIFEVSNGKYCVDFTRVEGDTLKFYEQFASIKDYLGDLIYSSY